MKTIIEKKIEELREELQKFGDAPQYFEIMTKVSDLRGQIYALKYVLHLIPDIELPEDEEIRVWAYKNSLVQDEDEPGERTHILMYEGIIKGAKWMRDKIVDINNSTWKILTMR